MLVKEISACEWAALPAFLPTGLLGNVYYKAPVTTYHDLVGSSGLVADDKNTCNDGNGNIYGTAGGGDVIEYATDHQCHIHCLNKPDCVYYSTVNKGKCKLHTLGCAKLKVSFPVSETTPKLYSMNPELDCTNPLKLKH